MGSRSKKQSQLDQNSDIISNLPDTVVEEILIRMPIRDAIRTSVLSSKWRFKWSSISQLCFDDYTIPSSCQEQQNKLLDFINHVLLVHRGRIQKFQLDSSYLEISSAVYYWILVLSRRGIKELVVRLYSGDYYTLPSLVFLCQDLCNLKVQTCKVKPPLSFEGFRKLKCLSLSDTTVDNEFLNRLISSSPLLESLELLDLNYADYLHICAPNLVTFVISSNFKDIRFEKTPLLSVVDLWWGYDYVNDDNYNNDDDIISKFLSGLTRMKEFTASGPTLELLGVGSIPEKLPSTFICLQKLCLMVNFDLTNTINVMMCLFNSSPNLQELKIWAFSDNYLKCKQNKIEYSWVSQMQMESNMKHIRRVILKKLEGRHSELNFIKYVLAKSPVLEMLSIVNLKGLQLQKLDLLKTSIEFPRVSAKAEIIFSEYNQNWNFI